MRTNSPTSISLSGGVHDDRGERRVGEPGQHGLEREDQDQRRHERGQPGPAGATADRVDDRRPAPRAADGEPADGAGRDVGRPRARSSRRASIRWEWRAPKARAVSRLSVNPTTATASAVLSSAHEPRDETSGTAVRGGARTRGRPPPDPLVRQVGRGDHEGGQQHPEQRDRAPRPPPGADEEQHQRPHRHRERPALHLLGVLQQPPRLAERRRVGDVGTGRTADLGEHHQAGDASHVADQHRLGEEVGEEGQPPGPGEEAHAPTARARSDATSSGTPGTVTVASAAPVISAVVDSGPDGELGRGAEQEVDGHGHERRPQAGRRGHPGQPGVGEHLRHEVGGHGDPGEHVAAQHRAGGGRRLAVLTMVPPVQIVRCGTRA